jgi:hypothetical protein
MMESEDKVDLVDISRKILKYFYLFSDFCSDGATLPPYQFGAHYWSPRREPAP